MKTTRQLTALGLVLLIWAVYLWLLNDRNRTVEYWYRSFITTIAEGDLGEAYKLTSDDFQNLHSSAAFAIGPWCNPSNMAHSSSHQIGLEQVYVKGLNPLSSRVVVIASTAAFSLPFWMEDGFVAVLSKMKKQDGRWVIDGNPDTVAR